MPDQLDTVSRCVMAAITEAVYEPDYATPGLPEWWQLTETQRAMAFILLARLHAGTLHAMSETGADIEGLLRNIALKMVKS